MIQFADASHHILDRLTCRLARAGMDWDGCLGWIGMDWIEIDWNGLGSKLDYHHILFGHFVRACVCVCVYVESSHLPLGHLCEEVVHQIIHSCLLRIKAKPWQNGPNVDWNLMINDISITMDINRFVRSYQPRIWKTVLLISWCSPHGGNLMLKWCSLFLKLEIGSTTPRMGFYKFMTCQCSTGSAV